MNPAELIAGWNGNTIEFARFSRLVQGNGKKEGSLTMELEFQVH